MEGWVEAIIAFQTEGTASAKALVLKSIACSNKKLETTEDFKVEKKNDIKWPFKKINLMDAEWIG